MHVSNVYKKIFLFPTVIALSFVIVCYFVINNQVSAQEGIPTTCVPNRGVKFDGVDSDKLIVLQNNIPLAVVYVSSYMPRPPYTFKFFGPELCDKGANSILMIKGGFYRATFIKYFEPETLPENAALVQ
jgi:hypothetical protein